MIDIFWYWSLFSKPATKSRLSFLQTNAANPLLIADSARHVQPTRRCASGHQRPSTKGLLFQLAWPFVMLRATPQLDGYPSPSFSATPPASRALWLDGYPSLVGSWTHLHAQWRASVGHRHTRRASAGFARWVSIAERRTGLYSAWSCSYGPRSSSRGLCDLGSSPVPDSGRSPVLHATS